MKNYVLTIVAASSKEDAEKKAKEKLAELEKSAPYSRTLDDGTLSYDDGIGVVSTCSFEGSVMVGFLISRHYSELSNSVVWEWSGETFRFEYPVGE